MWASKFNSLLFAETIKAATNEITDKSKREFFYTGGAYLLYVVLGINTDSLRAMKTVANLSLLLFIRVKQRHELKYIVTTVGIRYLFFFLYYCGSLFLTTLEASLDKFCIVYTI